ncbi:MAG: hypothetical protein ACXAB4_03170, partial [Candidatus Hodarchaeales archaeon]
MIVDYCSNCGSPLQDGSLFCEFCRTRVSTMAPPKEPGAPLQAQKDTIKPQQELSFAHLPAKPRKPAFESEPRGKKRLWIAIGVIVLLVISAAAIGGLWMMFRGHHYLGEKVAHIQSTTLPIFHVNITNAAGDVSIEFLDSNYIMNASAKVYGPGIADINDAADFTSNVVNGQYQLIEFDSSNGRDDLTY